VAPPTDARSRIITRAAREIEPGMNVNLGIGLPTLLADGRIGTDSEQPVLRLEHHAGDVGGDVGEADPDLINAGKETVTAVAGASYFDSAESFGMIRGGHIDLAILGGMEVSETGDLANWMVPGKMVKGMGGAMDLVQGAKRVIVIMEHLTRDGTSKLKTRCTLPLTGQRVVHRLITDLAVFEFTAEGMRLIELQDGVTLDELAQATEATFTVDPALHR
jgi:3-oxoacid CoA-transferase subunit B